MSIPNRYREDDIAIPSEDKLYKHRPWEEHRDDEGYLHHDTGPAARCRDQVWFYMKHGYIHNANGPAAQTGYLDAPEYWYFYEGEELGKNEYGWIKLWRITKNRDLILSLWDTGPYGGRVHNLKNLLTLITQEDLGDTILFNFIWPLVSTGFVPPIVEEEEYEEEYPALTDYEWDGEVTADA